MKKLIRGMSLVAAMWSIFPWGLAAILCPLGALLPDPGSIISFKVPWWAVLVVWGAEPLLLVLLWRSQESKGATLILMAFVGICLAFDLRHRATGLMFLWIGPTLLLLPLVFWRHWVARKS